ncbi:MAG TPA: cupin domain-containing protein [Chloroflexi bacterium]|nr:cupin domain-containing protein [Chloroflexota bacterium]
MASFADYRAYVGTRTGKFYKDTLFRGDHLMVGINCLEPGQRQPLHDHADADKVYVVMEGSGYFTLGDQANEADQGEVVWAPAGVPHGVENRHNERLVLLVAIAPPPGT